jgi:hypothetical protein
MLLVPASWWMEERPRRRLENAEMVCGELSVNDDADLVSWCSRSGRGVKRRQGRKGGGRGEEAKRGRAYRGNVATAAAYDGRDEGVVQLARTHAVAL